MIDARQAAIEFRRPDVAAIPGGEAVAQRGAVGLREEIQTRLDPDRRRGPCGIGGHGLAGNVRPAQRHVLVGEKKERMVAADRAAEGRGDIVQTQRTAALASDVGEPIVGRQQFVEEAATAEPWNSLEPERLVRATLAPGRRPISLMALEVCTRNSSTASMGRRESRLPKALIAGNTPPVAWAGNPPAVTPVLALAPSTVK